MQLATVVEELLVDFMVRFKVAKLSQPAALISVAVCVPPLLKVSPFHVNGRADGQMLRLVVDELVDLMLRFNVAVESQPAALVVVYV